VATLKNIILIAVIAALACWNWTLESRLRALSGALDSQQTVVSKLSGPNYWLRPGMDWPPGSERHPPGR
jgi:hypothetical protein